MWACRGVGDAVHLRELRDEVEEVDARDGGLPRAAVMLHVEVAERASHAELLLAVAGRLGHHECTWPVAALNAREQASNAPTSQSTAQYMDM